MMLCVVYLIYVVAEFAVSHKNHGKPLLFLSMSLTGLLKYLFDYKISNAE